MAAITTSPCPRSKFFPLDRSALGDLPGFLYSVSSAALKPAPTDPSATRPSGRFGPAIDGTTVARSSNSVSVKTDLASSWCDTTLVPSHRLRRERHGPVFAPTSRDKKASPNRWGRNRRSRHIPAPYWRSSRDRRATDGRGRARKIRRICRPPFLPQQLCDGKNKIGGCHPRAKRTGQSEADHLRQQHGERLAEHAGLGLDTADAQPSTASPFTMVVCESVPTSVSG